MWIIYGIKFQKPGHRFDGRIRYIGQTMRTLEHRWSQHCRSAAKGTRTALAQAIRKHGRDSFTPEILERVATLDEANRVEIDLIARNLVKIDHGAGGLNILAGGGAIDARDPVIRAKIRAVVNTPEFKQKNAKAWQMIRAAMTPEMLSINAKKANERKGAEGRSAAARKAAETKRLKRTRSGE
jgi:GIY-YIG catalytic domain